MQFNDYLKLMMEKDGSDLYLSTGAAASMKVHGKLLAINEILLAHGVVHSIAEQLMSESQRAQFEQRPEMNLAWSLPGVGRFRVNIFKQRNDIAMVVRAIKTNLPAFHTLGLPDVLTKLVYPKRGLLLVVGATSSGKSTTMASLVDYRNEHSAGHIITIEDPVEFMHKHKHCVVNQREVGMDTLSYHDALSNALRQAPDMILIGEVRHRETMEHALAYVEPGHLCLSTLHATNANQAIERILSFFPDDRQRQALLDLSMNLRGIVSQRLIPSTDGKRALAMEVLIATPHIQELIKRGEITAIKEAMEKGESIGMQTFDTALFKLYREGRIHLEEALKNADSRNNLRLRITLAEGKTVDDDNVIDSPEKYELPKLSLPIDPDLER